MKKLFLLSMLLLGLLTVQAQTGVTTWYLEDFESLDVLGSNKPEGWTVSTMTDTPQATFERSGSGGVDGSQALMARLQNTTTEYWFYTQVVNFGTQPIVEFQYKTTGVLGDAPANCVNLEIAVSMDNVVSWTMDLSDCHSGIYLLTIDGKAFKVSKR